MKFLRRTKGCTLKDQIRNEERIHNYRPNTSTSLRWRQHVESMNDDRLPRQVVHYRPRERRWQTLKTEQAAGLIIVEAQKKMGKIINEN